MSKQRENPVKSRGLCLSMGERAEKAHKIRVCALLVHLSSPSMKNRGEQVKNIDGQENLLFIRRILSEGRKMNRNKVVSLADVPECPTAVIAFYDRFRGRIADIEIVEQRNNVLSDMQKYFEREVRRAPQSRDKLSEVYQLLKRRCWEVGLYGNG